MLEMVEGEAVEVCGEVVDKLGGLAREECGEGSWAPGWVCRCCWRSSSSSAVRDRPPPGWDAGAEVWGRLLMSSLGLRSKRLEKFLM